VALTRATRTHPDLLRGASVRGAIDVVLVVRELAELEDLELREFDGRMPEAVLRACLVALSGRVTVRESCGRSAEDVIRELWEDETLLRVAASPGPTPTLAPPSVVARRGHRAVPAAAAVDVFTPSVGATDGQQTMPTGAAGAVRRALSDHDESGGSTPAAQHTVAALTDQELDDLAEIATEAPARSAHRRRRQQLAGTDPRLVHRLAVQIIVQRARRSARGARGSGRLRSARFRFQSDDLDLDRSIEELMGNPFPGHEDFWVQERAVGRRGVVLMVDVSGSMRGAPLVRAALTAASAMVAAAHDDLAAVLFWSRTLVVTSMDSPRPLMRVVEDVLAVRPEGLTDVALGLTTGLRNLERSRARERLGILVTDGVSNHGGDPAAVARLFPQLHVLTTGTTPRRVQACRRLAAAGNGECLPVGTIADIPAALTRCLGDGRG
jgi:Mg-chelatase subunit ChlD